MKKIFISILCVLSLNTNTFALTVFDPTNLAQNLITATNTIETLSNQLIQLQNEATNMLSVPVAFSTGQLNKLQQGFQSIQNIQNKATSQINNYKNFQNQFKNIYKDFKDFKDLDPQDYLIEANRLTTATRNIAEDGMRLVGIGDINKLKTDGQRVKAIMEVANSSAGQKSVAQAQVQMAAMTLEVLAEQRTLMASSLNSQNSYLMEKVQKEALAATLAEKIRESDPSLRNNGKKVNLDRSW